MSVAFDGPIGVVSVGGKIICYGETVDYHETVGAGGVRIRRGMRLAAVEFGTATEVAIEGDLRGAIDADLSRRRAKDHD